MVTLSSVDLFILTLLTRPNLWSGNVHQEVFCIKADLVVCVVTTCTPCTFMLSLNARARCSIASMYNMGDKEHPCLVLFWMAIG